MISQSHLRAFASKSLFVTGSFQISSVAQLCLTLCDTIDCITTNKASGGDGIPVELFQILKDDAVKVLHEICQQIWKT